MFKIYSFGPHILNNSEAFRINFECFQFFIIEYGLGKGTCCLISFRTKFKVDSSSHPLFQNGTLCTIFLALGWLKQNYLSKFCTCLQSVILSIEYSECGFKSLIVWIKYEYHSIENRNFYRFSVDMFALKAYRKKYWFEVLRNYLRVR